jgi:hypothetical protein
MVRACLTWAMMPQSAAVMRCFMFVRSRPCTVSSDAPAAAAPPPRGIRRTYSPDIMALDAGKMVPALAPWMPRARCSVAARVGRTRILHVTGTLRPPLSVRTISKTSSGSSSRKAP